MYFLSRHTRVCGVISHQTELKQSFGSIEERLPTKVKLQNRKISMANNDTRCPLCGKDEESVSYVLFTCKISWEIWALSYRWQHFDMPHATISILTWIYRE